MTGDRNSNDTLRMAAAELDALIAEMNRAGDDFSGNSRRKLRRWAYTGTRVPIDLIEHNGHRRRIVAAPRDLSAGGMCVLHGGFIHPGVGCAVTLVQIGGTRNVIAGLIVRCRHVRGRLHESGVSFVSQIRPEDYVAFGDGAVFHVEHVDPAALDCTVLVCMSNAAEQRLVSHYLRDTNATVLFANDLDAAKSMLDEHPKVAFIDHEINEQPGIDVLRDLRECGLTCPIALLADHLSEATRERGLSAGATEVLGKPFTRELLLRAITEFVERGLEPRGAQSRVANAASARDVGLPLTLLEEFVGELRAIAHTIDEQVGRSDCGGLQRTLRELCSAASGYGFKVVAAAADDVGKMIKNAGAIEIDPALTQELTDLCRSARAFP